MNPENMNGNTGFVTGDEANINQTLGGNTVDAVNVGAGTVPQPQPTSVVNPTPSTVPQDASNVVPVVPTAPIPEVAPQAPVSEPLNANPEPVGVVPQNTSNVVPETPVAPIPEVIPQVPVTEPLNVNPEPVGVVPQNAVGVTTEESSLPPETAASGGENSPTDPKQSKCKKIFILAAVILVLTVVGVVLGILFFNKFGADKKKTTEPLVTENSSTVISANVINNDSVNAQDLTNVLKLLGIGEKNVDALTFYVTNENYKDNAKEIVTYYAIFESDMTLLQEDADSYKTDNGACANAEGCAIISKDNAEKILKLYNFSGELKDYFYKSEKSDDMYGIHYGTTLVLPKFDGTNLGIGHNLTAKYVGDNDIDIEDKQLFNYNDDEGQFKSVNRVAKYTFKKDADGIYYLDSVLISE